jgi:hypothetical protein
MVGCCNVLEAMCTRLKSLAVAHGQHQLGAILMYAVGVSQLHSQNNLGIDVHVHKGYVCEGNGPKRWLDPPIPKNFFLKSTPTFLLFTSNQSLFITIQIKKSLQNKIFHFII